MYLVYMYQVFGMVVLFETFRVLLCTAFMSFAFISSFFSTSIFLLSLIKILKHEVNVFVHLHGTSNLLTTYYVPDTPQGSDVSQGAPITFPFGLYFSLKNNCTEQTRSFKLGLETKSRAANCSC